MRRRDFITLLGGTAAAWPLAARAQQPALPVVGWLHAVSAPSQEANVAALRKGLGEHGLVEGRDFAIEYALRTMITIGCPSWRPIWCTGRWP